MQISRSRNTRNTSDKRRYRTRQMRRRPMTDDTTPDQDRQTALAPRRAPIAHRDALWLPAVIAPAGERASRRFVEYFAAEIRNPHTRRAYGNAVARFLAWCDARGVALEQLQ